MPLFTELAVTMATILPKFRNVLFFNEKTNFIEITSNFLQYCAKVMQTNLILCSRDFLLARKFKRFK